MSMHEEINQWSDQIQTYHFPRWEELPDFDIYMDQVISLVEKYLSFLSENEEDRIITSSMVNNYVKLHLIPKPEKKRYSRVHIAYLIAITVLKQVVSIKEVRDGIEIQAGINGLKGAYNLFCEEQEHALQQVGLILKKEQNTVCVGEISSGTMAMKMATMAFASKMAAQKYVSLHMKEETR